ncbi:serine/threonine-protein kinase [Streptosporangium sp. KLBMP 9127]
MRVVAERYRLLDRLGAGGAGTVWRARDELLQRDVAVKEVRLASGLNGHDRALRNTLREARAAAALSHPGIITVHDVIAENGQPWIIMDLLSGRSLRELTNDLGRLPLGQAATVGLRVLDALGAAHRHGILHHDVKPGNVMITDAGEVILADFGIASQQALPPGPGQEGTDAGAGHLAGSPGYIAPERLRGEAPGPAADLWSLGATLYAAIEGRPPFARDSMVASIAAVLTVPTPPPAAAGPLTGLLLAMLDKNPAMRPSPGQVKAELEPLAIPMPSRRAATGPVTVPVVVGRRRRTPIVIGAFATGAAVATTVAVLLNGGAGPDTTITTTTASPSLTATATVAATPTSAPAPTRTPGPTAAGSFATAPRPCELLTAEQVQTIVPQAGEGSARGDECSWHAFLGPSIAVEVTHAASPDLAKRTFAYARQTRTSQAGTSQTTTTTPVRTVPSLADGAFAQDTANTTFKVTTGTVWLRHSNLVITVKATGEGTKVDSRVAKTALTAARTVDDNLRKRS